MSKKNDKQKDIEAEEIKKVEREFIPQEKILEEKMINGLLNYVREGKLPKGGNSIFMDCYNIIYNYTDKQIGDFILDYHNDIVKKACTECYEKLKSLQGLDFIDSFISYTDRLNTLIFNLSRMFLYISSNHLKAQEEKDNKRKYDQEDVSEFSMDIFKKEFFNKLESKLFNTLNEILIREERNGNMEHRLKINTIMKTITFLDYEKPKIARSSATKTTWIDTIKEGDKKDIKIPYQDKWYHSYFKDETKKYVKNKAERDIKVNSAPEYVKCELKYIDEERERQVAYINASFHNDINDINYEYLIKDNANQIAEMDTGIKYMFQTKRKEELAEVFQLFNYYPSCLELIQKRFRAYIKDRLTALYNDKELSKDPRKFVPAKGNG